MSAPFPLIFPFNTLKKNLQHLPCAKINTREIVPKPWCAKISTNKVVANQPGFKRYQFLDCGDGAVDKVLF